MASFVSICIPTYCRPDLVQEAVRSALEQAYPNLEVWVSDDSPDDRTETALADWIARQQIRYVRNKPALRQARNVNQLFHLATGDLLILLHDDDLLVPGAIAKLAACFEADPSISAAFGKQYWMDHQGRIDLATSSALNAKYRRVAARAGRQSCPMESALVAQFPNDGFMVKTAIARQVGSTRPQRSTAGFRRAIASLRSRFIAQRATAGAIASRSRAWCKERCCSARQP